MTVQEVLLKSGWTQAQIDALDANALNGFTQYMNTVEQTAAQKEQAAKDAEAKAEADRQAGEKAKADAELLQRSNSSFYEEKIVPGLTSWQEEKIKLTKLATDAAAEAAFYKAQRATLTDAGFLPADSPTFTPVTPAADPNATPGTPKFTIQDVKNDIGTALGTVANIQWKYQSLYGRPMPISPTDLLAQSEANKFKDPATYANHIFKFAEKEEELRQAAAKAHDDDIAKKSAEAKEAEWKAKMEAREAEIAVEKKKIAEGQGNNPNVRTPPGSAQFSDLQRATKDGERPDPLKMSPQERRKTTLDNIHKALEERQQAVA